MNQFIISLVPPEIVAIFKTDTLYTLYAEFKYMYIIANGNNFSVFHYALYSYSSSSSSIKCVVIVLNETIYYNIYGLRCMQSAISIKYKVINLQIFKSKSDKYDSNFKYLHFHFIELKRK